MSGKKGFQLPTDEVFDFTDDGLDGTDICLASGYEWHLPKMVGAKGTSIDMEDWNGSDIASRMRRWPGRSSSE
tara:strand:- start:1752 stop:1970 length:219 start_codon:yes stop_codon:yes gene_type:complete